MAGGGQWVVGPHAVADVIANGHDRGPLPVAIGRRDARALPALSCNVPLTNGGGPALLDGWQGTWAR